MSTSLNGQIDHLSTCVFNTANYNFSNRIQGVNDVFNGVKTTVNNYGQGKIPDFDISSTYGSGQISFFNTINSKTAYNVSCPQGSYTIFYTDVWVPSTSNQYQNYVDCLTKV